MSDPLISLLRRAADAVEPLVGAVTAADHRRATPCPDLDLKGLTAHLIGGLYGFADAAEGKALNFGSDPDLSTRAPGSEFRKTVDRMIAGFSQPGMIGRTFAMPWGDNTGAQLVGFVLNELVVHGWDIARSLGRQPTFDDDVVAATLAGVRQWVDESARIPQLFGPEVNVAADAPVLDQLVGFLGRHPTWAPLPNPVRP